MTVETEVVPEEVKEQPAQEEAQPAGESEQPKEDVATLKAQLAEYQSKVQQAEERWKNEQRNTTKKDQEIQRLRDLKEDVSFLKDSIKILAAEIATGKGESEQEFLERTGSRKTDLLKQYEDLETKRKQAEMLRKVEDYRVRTEALGLTPNDEEYHDIKDLVENGRFERADLRLKKIEDSKKKEETPKAEGKKENKVESEEARINRLAEEKARKMLEESGALKTGVSNPSGGSLSWDDVTRKYTDGELNTSQYREYAKRFNKI